VSISVLANPGTAGFRVVVNCDGCSLEVPADGVMYVDNGERVVFRCRECGRPDYRYVFSAPIGALQPHPRFQRRSKNE
jgi:hypothetical protein